MMLLSLTFIVDFTVNVRRESIILRILGISKNYSLYLPC